MLNQPLGFFAFALSFFKITFKYEVWILIACCLCEAAIYTCLGENISKLIWKRGGNCTLERVIVRIQLPCAFESVLCFSLETALSSFFPGEPVSCFQRLVALKMLLILYSLKLDPAAFQQS